MMLQIKTAAELETLSDGGKLPVILHFWAGWAPMCTQTKELASRLAGECPNVRFAHVEAEEAEVHHASACYLTLHKCYCYSCGGISSLEIHNLPAVPLSICRTLLRLTALNLCRHLSFCKR